MKCIICGSKRFIFKKEKQKVRFIGDDEHKSIIRINGYKCKNCNHKENFQNE